MDLILRDENFSKKRIIKKPSFSCNCGLYGASTNDFQLVLTDDEIIKIGEIVTYGLTEYGGRVSCREFNTAENTVTYTGKTFRGQLEYSIIAKAWELTLEGTPYKIAKEIIEYSELDYSVEFIDISETKAITIPTGSNALKAFDLLTAAFGLKMKLSISDGVKISLAPCVGVKYDGDEVPLIITESNQLPTALHAYGESGNVSVFLQEDGSVGSDRFYTGFKAVEICEELKADENEVLEIIAADRLLALRNTQSVSELTLGSLDIGETVTVSSKKHGISSVQTVNEIAMTFDGLNAEITTNTGG